MVEMDIVGLGLHREWGVHQEKCSSPTETRLNWQIWSGWWFGTFIFPYIGNNNPIWLIFFRGVGIPPTSGDSTSSTKWQCSPDQLVDDLVKGWCCQERPGWEAKHMEVLFPFGDGKTSGTLWQSNINGVLGIRSVNGRFLVAMLHDRKLQDGPHS